MKKEIVPWWFTPDYQPNPDQPVKFHLKPLDAPTALTVQNGIDGRGGVTSDAALAAYDFAVIGWQGLTKEFSLKAKREVLAVASLEWMVWLGQIAGVLYRNAVLSEEERKNS